MRKFGDLGCMFLVLCDENKSVSFCLELIFITKS